MKSTPKSPGETFPEQIPVTTGFYFRTNQKTGGYYWKT